MGKISIGKIKHSITIVTLVVWVSILSLVIACLMVGHWVSLPHPDRDQPFPTKLSSLSKAGHDSSWTALHFLYAECPCSRRVMQRIVQRQALSDLTEKIVLIGESSSLTDTAMSQGFEVDIIKPDQLQERYGVESAPLLVVLDPEGIVQYSGGYTSRKQGLAIQEEAIISAIISGQKFDDLPVFGCAVSKRLKSIVDPLGIK